jgi:hypothetical protein
MQAQSQSHLSLAIEGARRMATLQASPAVRHAGGRIDSVAWTRAEMIRLQYISLAEALARLETPTPQPYSRPAGPPARTRDQWLASLSTRTWRDLETVQCH